MTRDELNALGEMFSAPGRDPLPAIDQYRIKKGLRPEDIAKQAGIPASTYRSLYNGQTDDPRMSTVLALVDWRLNQ